MEDRTEKIFNCIVEHYIKEAEPVGSRVLSKMLDIKLSAATVRNIMSDLTDAGLISQPYTSAGRLPTDKGYRYYVNNLLESEELSESISEEELIESELDSVTPPSRLEDILTEAANDLSMATNCTGIVISPNLEISKLRKIRFISLSERQVLVVLITQSGMVRNKIIQLRESPDSGALNSISTLLGDLFEGLTFGEIREKLVSTIAGESHLYEDILPQAIRLAKRAFDFDSTGEVYISGRSNMCAFPEFQDRKSLKVVYRVLDEKNALKEIFSNVAASGGLQVQIGNENKYDGLGHCSVIATTYGNRDYLLGSIGIIGPTRINYSGVISAIDYSSQKLSDAVSRFLE